MLQNKERELDEYSFGKIEYPQDHPPILRSIVIMITTKILNAAAKKHHTETRFSTEKNNEMINDPKLNVANTRISQTLETKDGTIVQTTYRKNARLLSCFGKSRS